MTSNIPGYRTERFLKDLEAALSELEFSNGEGDNVPIREGLKRLHKYVTATRPNSKVMLIGNGGSAAIASHAALDLWKNGGVKATAFNDLVQLTALSNDYGFDQVFLKAVERFADPVDVLIAISSSGRSENIVLAAKAARELECVVITFSGFSKDNPLFSLGDLNLHVPSNRYGIVESTHLAVIHGLIEDLSKEVINQ